jgi:small subunit ribosomal protein S1
MSDEQIIIEEAAVEATAPTGTAELHKKTKLKGTVNRIELYGAFIDVGLTAPAILHISQLPERVNRVSDLLSLGQEVEVWVDKYDQARNQVTVTMQKPLAVEWGDLAEGQTYTGKVVRLENFGAFVDIGAEKEGLVHVSEMSHGYVKHPSEVAKVGDDIEVQVLGYSRKKRRINLSMKTLQEKPEVEIPPQYQQSNSNTNNNNNERYSNNRRDTNRRSAPEPRYEAEEEFEEEIPTAMEMALRAAMGDDVSFKVVAKGGRKGSKQNKERKAARRAQQEDIILRTLELAAQAE